jgi:hypothetical protein
MVDAVSHEFNATDDAVFLALAGSAARVGIAGYGFGFTLATTGLLGLFHPPFHLPPHAAPVIAGICLLGAIPPVLAGRQLRVGAHCLRAVATTTGDDIAHLMAAVDGLQRAFTTLVAMLAVHGVGLAVVVALMFPRGA